jgi:hypothetical protein
MELRLRNSAQKPQNEEMETHPIAYNLLIKQFNNQDVTFEKTEKIIACIENKLLHNSTELNDFARCIELKALIKE